MNPIDLVVNGTPRTGTVAARTHLADFLRADLNLTGTHLGCEHGVCGACTLMIDGRPMRSCLMLAVACDGASVHTIEGFDDDPLMRRLRQAFSKHHALQCGYCTPGMLVTAYDIVRRLPQADPSRVREELAGNLCRCTGYMGIVAAISDVLANDPPPAPVQPIRRRPGHPPSGPVTAVATVAAAPAATAPPTDLPVSLGDDGTVLRRRIGVSAPADAVWSVLQDMPRVAACLPGARIERQDGDIVHGALAVAVGPIKVRFQGRATVIFDAERRAGAVVGSGGDAVSRSTADGALEFELTADGDAACAVTAALRYRLKGPLAQFGRPSVVAAVVDGLLADFARNLVAVAQGQAPAAPVSLNGFRLVRRVLLEWLKQMLRRS